MNRWSVSKMVFPWLLLLVVTSCGTTTDYAGGGIGGTGISVGRITNFGSVWVNGVEYSTSGAIIWIEGSGESTSDGTQAYDRGLLDEGKIVTVHWENDANGNPVAKRIEFKDNLEGVVTAVDVAAQTIDVMGQTIKVDVSTWFKNSITDEKIPPGDVNAILGEIVQGNVIEVSGFVVDSNGTIQAAYIELKSNDFVPGITKVEIKGVIANLTDTPEVCTFNIGTLTVACDSVNELPPGGLSNNLYVEVKGTIDLSSGMVLKASKIEIEDDIFDKAGDESIELEGFVTRSVDESGQFEINGLPVSIITGITKFKDGATVVDIQTGVKIEVEGKVDANGVLIASEIDIKSSDH
ncbi:MAG: hypothetical protein IT393_09360 [Nitrospirae bacterium]|nr:hypothetical protein [Nitrospirota bacterium]